MAKTQKRNFRKSNIFKLKEEVIKTDINKTIKNGNDIELNYSFNPLRLRLTRDEQPSNIDSIVFTFLVSKVVRSRAVREVLK